MTPHALPFGSGPLPVLIGQSPVVDTLRAEIERAGRSDARIMVLGETGVGKEVVARLIHAESARRSKAFVAVNCAGIPETLLASELFGHARGSFTGAYRDRTGLVRQAENGTLFLDEVGEMGLPMQAMLLRFAETGEVQPVGADLPIGRTNVRLITATHRDLMAQVTAGAFREDLYYRLNVIQIRIPPLRDRGNDILLLFRHYMQVASEAHRLPMPELASCAREAVLNYSWPGNVRELKNVTERLVLRDARHPITMSDLPHDVHSGERRDARSSTFSVPHTYAPAVPTVSSTPMAERLWEELATGQDFWNVVHRRFRVRELTRADLTALIDRGLKQTLGSYRALLALFNLPPGDYKRFHAFLYQQKCNLPVRRYRNAALERPLRTAGSTQYRAVS